MTSILVLFFSVIISAFIVVKFNIKDKALQLLLSFSGAYLITVSFTHIIPNIFNGEHNQTLGYFVLVGFFIQLFIEFLSGGVEHGHGHCASNHVDHDHIHEPAHEKAHQQVMAISPYALLIGISLHSFFEGMPFADNFHTHAHSQHTLLIGIIIHKIPIALALMGLFLSSGLSNLKSYMLILIFALSAPLGAFSGDFIGNLVSIPLDYLYKIIMAILVGIFLHVSTTILFESNTSHRFNLYKIITIIVGVAAAILSKML
ncbi:MAG: ZIP family metal transporter [Bacteroidales bacterium]|nr:ZIP family metal transporter [Bacteroidales bacterium]